VTKLLKKDKQEKSTQKDSKILIKTFNNEFFLSLEIVKAKG